MPMQETVCPGTRNERETIRRRDFLALGGASVASLIFPTSLADSSERVPSGLLRVGYLAGSQHLDLQSNSWSSFGNGVLQTTALSNRRTPFVSFGDVIDAADLAAGDDRLCASGIRLTVRGFCSPLGVENSGNIQTASLDVSYQPFSEGTYHAWHYDNLDVPNISPANSFVVPIDEDWGLNMDLRVSSSSVERKVPVRLAIRNEARSPKLRQGVYYLLLQDPELVSLCVGFSVSPVCVTEEGVS